MKDLKKIITLEIKKDIAWRLKAGVTFKKAVEIALPTVHYQCVLRFFRSEYDVYSAAAVVKNMINDQKLIK